MFHLSCTAVKVVFGFGYFTYKYLNGDSKFRRKHLGWWSRGDFLRRRPISHQLGNHLPGDNDDHDQDDQYVDEDQDDKGDQDVDEDNNNQDIDVDFDIEDCDDEDRW